MAEALLRSPRLEKLYCAPGSDALAEVAERVDVSATDLDGLVRLVKDVGIGLTVVGPEAPLVAGIRDRFDSEGLLLFGPSKAAAALEGSKVFTKNLLKKYRIPTAGSRVYDDSRLALQNIRQQNIFPVVIKADGLAAGKGVVVAQDAETAEAALDRIMVRREFGESGLRVLVEDFLEGEECSVLAFTDGKTILALDAAKDHKAAYDGDAGPNTGGMGAFCPSPLVQGEIYKQIESQVLLPIVHAMGREGKPYQGILYAGLMITQDGPRVLEFNVRFGDPEAQVILPRLQTDFVDIAEKTALGQLDQIESLDFSSEVALVVVLASAGYPGKPALGRRIKGLEEAAQCEGVRLFHAGTRKDGEHWYTSGGRVLGVTALGENLEDARRKAYAATSELHFEGMHYRRDIGIDRSQL